MPLKSTKHLCHAKACQVTVPERMFMCSRHWRMVPRPMQDQIWEHYREGQEIRKDPSVEYLGAAQIAIAAVAEREGVN